MKTTMGICEKTHQNKFILHPRYLILVNVLLITVYLFTLITNHYLDNLNDMMFWAPDAGAYKSVADWMFGINESGWEVALVRPYFYPFLLNLSRSFAGLTGIWLMQFLMWLLSANFIAFAIYILTRKYIFTTIGVILFASNITAILLTAHALTEVTAIFLLSLYAFFVVTNRNKILTVKFFFIIMLVSTFLAVVKQIFVPFSMVIFSLLIAFVLFKKIEPRLKIKLISVAIIGLLPITVQMAIVKVNHNTFSATKMGHTVLYQYFFSKLYGKVHNLSVAEARPFAGQFSKGEILLFSIENFSYTWQTYWESFKGNITAGSSYVHVQRKRPHLDNYMRRVNKYYWYLHWIMVMPILIFLCTWIRNGKETEFIPLIALIVPVSIILLVSPLSFWQGDRLVLPSLPLWIILYTFIGANVLRIADNIIRSLPFNVHSICRLKK